MGNCCGLKNADEPRQAASVATLTANYNRYSLEAHGDPGGINRARPAPPRTPREPTNRIVVGIYDYTSRDSNDVAFKKGDRMEVVSNSNGEWLYVTHLTTRAQGFVPGNFVADELSIEREDWFFESLSRKEAEKLLISDKNPRGTFLVRPSEHNPNGFSLSIKDWQDSTGYQIRHYKIKPVDNGGFAISANKPFLTLVELVETYSKNSLGLCQVLRQPCPKPQPTTWDLGSSYQDKWEISREHINLSHRLGQGNFGEVWCGTWKNTTEVAVKMLKEGTMSTQAFLEEAAIMKKFRHKCLITLFGVCSEQEPIYIVQEYMSKGSLLQFLRDDEGRTVVFEDLVDIAFQVASGMTYLESKQLIHRDLAARNVLIGENNVAKICDFGLARIIEDDEYCTKQGSRFPVKWTAPEAIIYGKFSIKSDVWSYGIMLMELFTYGQIPYPGIQRGEIVQMLVQGYRMPKPSSDILTDEIYQTMLSCWERRPEKRPTFEFLTHYFEGFNAHSEGSYREA